MSSETQNESLEESIFKTLSNQKRRDILRFIGEHRAVSFTEVKKAVEVEDSSSLSYHLRSMQELVVQQSEQYVLSDLGQQAYNLIVKTNAYTSNSTAVRTVRKQLSALIVVNAVFWAAALLAASQFEGNLSVPTLSSFVVLWFVSNAVIYWIVRSISRGSSCPFSIWQT